MDRLTSSNLFSSSSIQEYAMKPVYGPIHVWHIAAFLMIGPMITWPMLILLIGIYVTNVNAFKATKSTINNNG